MSDALPDYLYKLIPMPPPDPLPEELPLSNLDKISGFIHLSTAAQVPGVLKLFFADEEKMYIFKIPLQPIQEKIHWESPDGKVRESIPKEGLFPHLYDGKLGNEEIESIITLTRGSGWDSESELKKIRELLV